MWAHGCWMDSSAQHGPLPPLPDPVPGVVMCSAAMCLQDLEGAASMCTHTIKVLGFPSHSANTQQTPVRAASQIKVCEWIHDRALRVKVTGLALALLSSPLLIATLWNPSACSYISGIMNRAFSSTSTGLDCGMKTQPLCTIAIYMSVQIIMWSFGHVI